MKTKIIKALLDKGLTADEIDSLCAVFSEEQIEALLPAIKCARDDIFSESRDDGCMCDNPFYYFECPVHQEHRGFFDRLFG